VFSRPLRALRFSLSVCSSYVHSRRRTADGVCDEERSERGIRVIRSLPPKRKSTATHRAHASIYLASRRSGSTRLLLALGADFFVPKLRIWGRVTASGAGYMRSLVISRGWSVRVVICLGYPN